MPFTLVQQDSDTDSVNGASVTFTSGATAGNLLVVALGHRRDDAEANPVLTGTTGMTRHYAYTDNTGGNKGVALFSKVADGGETTFTASQDGRWWYMVAAEFSPPSGILSYFGADDATANSGATTLTANVPDPSTTDSLAWVQAFGRDSSGTTVTFDSGFATAEQTGDLAASWVDDANGVTGNDVTVTYTTSRVAIMGTGVWSVASDALDTPGSVTLTATSGSRTLDGSWGTVAAADDYDWAVEEDSSGSWAAFESGTTASTSLELTSTDGVAWDTQYRLRVRASATGETSSPYSAFDVAAVGSEPTAAATSARSVRWSGAWVAPTA